MRDFVSGRATSLVGWVASMSIVCGGIFFFDPYGLRWPALAGLSLALSIWQMIQGAQSEQALVVATTPPSMPLGRRSREKGMP
jgi:hypothetical protein